LPLSHGDTEIHKKLPAR